MRVRLTFKTPDVVEDAVEESVECHTTPEAEHEVRKACKKWVRHDEYVTIEVDTEKGTAEVVPA